MKRSRELAFRAYLGLALTLAACNPSGPSRSNEGFARSIPNLQQLTDPIRNYLEHQADWAFTSIGGRVFCGFNPLGFQRGRSRDRVYILVNCREFTATSDPKTEGSGAAGPGVILVDHDGNIVGHESPGDGNFAHDVPALFPKALVEEVFEYSGPQTKTWLPASPEAQANQAFGRSDL